MVPLLSLFDGSFQWRCSAVALNSSTLYIFNIIQPFLKETTYCSCDLTIWVFKKGVCLLIPGIYIYLCTYSINRENHGKSFALGAQIFQKTSQNIHSYTRGLLDICHLHIPPMNFHKTPWPSINDTPYSSVGTGLRLGSSSSRDCSLMLLRFIIKHNNKN